MAIFGELDTDVFLATFKAHQTRAGLLKVEPLKKRKERLRSIRKWIFAHRADIRAALYADLQKPAHEADLSEIYPVLTEIRHVLKSLSAWTKPQPIAGGPTYIGTSAYIHYEPKGTCLIISPWNYPFNLALGPVISAIAAGNTVILKPSEFTPHTNKVVSQLFEDLFDEDMLKIEEGDAEVATRLLQLPFDHIFFTGSPAIGKKVMEAAAKNLSSVTLELGGKSPTIVDETADLRDAASKIAWAKWLNAGQTCVAPDYLFVHHAVKETLLDELKKQADKLYGATENYTAIINERHFARLNAAIKEAFETNAGLEFGGKIDEEHRKIFPIAFSCLPPESSLLQEEIFGPILPVLTYDDLDEAIQFINARPKPLALYCFSKSTKTQTRVLRETSSGTAVVNDAVLQFAHPNLPFGGVNNSGIGKAHGKTGFLAFSNEKSVLKQRTGMTMAKTVYPPYTTVKKKMIDLMLKYF